MQFASCPPKLSDKMYGLILTSLFATYSTSKGLSHNIVIMAIQPPHFKKSDTQATLRPRTHVQ